MLHKSVFLEESLKLLQLKPGEVVVDATLGGGGHSQKIAEAIGSTGRLIGIDQDPASIERCQKFFESQKQVVLKRANFVEIEKVLKELNLSGIDAVMVDTGFSSDQLEDPQRGLSFERDGPLDMRLNPEGPVTASDLVRELPENELAKIFWEYGEERRSRQFAKILAEERRKQSIETTGELVKILSLALPGHPAKKKNPRIYGRHFATRIFQALRIAVNDELNVLQNGLHNFWKLLRPGGRIVIISFHSLEDRIVKHTFRHWQLEGAGTLLTKKPIQVSREEMRMNSRSRSAKLRGILKK